MIMSYYQQLKSAKLHLVILIIFFVFLHTAMAEIVVEGNTVIFLLDSQHPKKNRERFEKIVQWEKEIKYDETKEPHINKELGFNPSAKNRLEGQKVAVSKDHKMAILLSYSCTQWVHAAENPWKCEATATVLDAEGYVLNQNVIKGNYLYVQVHHRLPYFILYCHTCCDGPRAGALFQLNGDKLCDIKNHRDDSWVDHPEYRCIGDSPEKIFTINLAARRIKNSAQIHKNPGKEMIDTLPENSKVHIIEKEKDWVLVDDNTKKGWIHKKNLEKDFVFFRKKSNLPEDRIERLTVLVHDVNFEVKMMAAQALAETADRRAWDVLTGALEDINPETRYAALCALGSRNNQQWVTPIIKMLKKEIALNVLTCGIRILGDLGDKRATKLLIGFLSHEDATVRWDAASSLGKTGDPLAVKALIVTLKDDNNTVVSNAADALGKIKDSSAVEPLIYLLKRKELQLREQALLALKNITKLDFGLDFNKWLEWWKGKSNFTYRRVFDNC